MQDKHVVIIRASEDRDIFVNKVKYPKTVYHIEGKGKTYDDEIEIDHTIGFPAILSHWILNNWDNLPEYVIFSQANPNDHVESMELAIDSTFTDHWGSLCYARSFHNQYSTDWGKCAPLNVILKKLGINFFNDNNVSKMIYCFYPGDHFYISRERIKEKTKQFYLNLIHLDKTENFFKLIDSVDKPFYFWQDLKKYHPELNGLSREEKYKIFAGPIEGRDWGYFGYCTEMIFSLLFGDKKFLEIINLGQASIGNKLYFNTNFQKYDLNFSFNRYPYSLDHKRTYINFKLFENSWFDYNCPYYLKWREKLIEKTIWEGEQKGFDGKQLLEFYEKIGYKHISL